MGHYALVVHIYIWRNLNGKSGKTLPAVGVQGCSTVQEKGPAIFTVRELRHLGSELSMSKSMTNTDKS